MVLIQIKIHLKKPESIYESQNHWP